MKLAVFGSRTLKDNRVRAIIYDELQETGADTIVTAQEPLGVCTVAQKVAKDSAIVLKLHFLNIPKYARGAFDHRSRAIVDDADKVLIIHDGKSKGTSNELKLVQQKKKPFRYEVLTPTDDNIQRPEDDRMEAFQTRRRENEDLEIEFDTHIDFDLGDDE